MAKKTLLSLVMTVCVAAVMGAVKPDARVGVTSLTQPNAFPAPMSTSVSTARGADHITTHNDTEDVTLNCTNTKTPGEVFSCIMEGIFSRPVLIQAGIVVLIVALFVLVIVVRSKACRNGREPAKLNMDEEMKMMA